MSVTFTKLFSSITESTVWCEPDHVRLLWITMLAMADRHGRVWGSIPGLANRARIPVESARDGIIRFLSPDPDSRTPDNEGRRIEPIDGGWRLLNHEKYRAIRDEQSILESKRKYINARREKERGIKAVESVDRGRANAEAEAEADTKNKDIVRGKREPAISKPDGVGDQLWEDFLKLRKARKAPVTLTVLSGMEREAIKAGISLAAAIKMCCERNWQGFKASWITGVEEPQARRPSTKVAAG